METPLPDFPSRPCTAFEGTRRLMQGPLADVALAAKQAIERQPSSPILVFDDSTGAVVDLDLRGTPEAVIARLAERTTPTAPTRRLSDKAEDQPAASRGRGRPKLGVVAREVTLLPRHWEWLARQPGGASATLRRLIDEARRADAGRSVARAAREAAYRFMSAIAGDLPGFEEAARALFADDLERFRAETASWPADIPAHVATLAWPLPA